MISDGRLLYLTGYKTIYALKPASAAQVSKKKKAAKSKQQGSGNKGKP